MTIHVPKWLVWMAGALLVAAAIAAAFVIGQSSGGDDDAATATENTAASEQTVAETDTESSIDGPVTTPDEPAAQPAKCSESAAKKATLAAGFADRIEVTGDIQIQLAGVEDEFVDPAARFFDPIGGYSVAILECRDLTGDGADEMVVALSAGAAGRIFNWAIFTPDENGDWQVAFSREAVPISTLKIRGEAVIERSPTFAQGDPMCCPSGHRATEAAYEGGEFAVVSPVSSQADRLIEVTDDAVTGLGPFDPQSDSSVQAVAEFGTPSSIGLPGDELCDYAWSDVGLRIHFVNLGGKDSCGPAGRVGSIELLGTPAAQAGWATSEGAQVGMSLGELRELYPAAKRHGDELILVERPSPYGDGPTPTLTAYLADDEAIAFVLGVGAGGE